MSRNSGQMKAVEDGSKRKRKGLAFITSELQLNGSVGSKGRVQTIKSSYNNGSNRQLQMILAVLLAVATLELFVGHYMFVLIKEGGGGPGDTDGRGRPLDHGGIVSHLERFLDKDYSEKLQIAAAVGVDAADAWDLKVTKGSKLGKTALDHMSSKEHFRNIFKKAGLEATDEFLNKLPPYSEAVELYGETPVIIGLDRCDIFRRRVDSVKAYIGGAGMFNAGTNLLASLLKQNCFMPDQLKLRPRMRGMLWQVPWGKHTPASWRFRNIAVAGGKGIVQEDVLAVVITKDPYTWMGSMCRHSYAANWRHFPEHCPNLVPNDVERRRGIHKRVKDGHGIPVNVRYNKTHVTHHSSLAGLWNDWYGEYYNATFPRLIIRFEDLLLRAEETLSQVCHCAGGKMNNKFQYVTDSAKGQRGPHAGAGGLVSSLTRYTRKKYRREGWTDVDLDYASKELNRGLLDSFRYHVLEKGSKEPSSR